MKKNCAYDQFTVSYKLFCDQNIFFTIIIITIMQYKYDQLLRTMLQEEPEHCILLLESTRFKIFQKLI